jgi:hypothetical protein
MDAREFGHRCIQSVVENFEVFLKTFKLSVADEGLTRHVTQKGEHVIC